MIDMSNEKVTNPKNICFYIARGWQLKIWVYEDFEDSTGFFGFSFRVTLNIISME